MLVCAVIWLRFEPVQLAHSSSLYVENVTPKTENSCRNLVGESLGKRLIETEDTVSSRLCYQVKVT